MVTCGARVLRGEVRAPPGRLALVWPQEQPALGPAVKVALALEEGGGVVWVGVGGGGWAVAQQAPQRPLRQGLHTPLPAKPTSIAPFPAQTLSSALLSLQFARTRARLRSRSRGRRNHPPPYPGWSGTWAYLMRASPWRAHTSFHIALLSAVQLLSVRGGKGLGGARPPARAATV